VTLALPLGAKLWTQVESVTVAVDGLACPFCSFGLEKRIKKVPGVAEIEVDVAGGSAEITAIKGASIDFAAIPTAVRKAGFTAGDLRIIVLGTLKSGDEGLLRLQIAGSDDAIRVVAPMTDVAVDLEELARAGARVRASGKVRLKEGDLPSLDIESISGIE